MTHPQAEQAARLGQQLRERRRQLGLTQADLALVAGVTQKTISLIEMGKPTARLDVVLAVADALGLRVIAAARGAAPETTIAEADGA